MQKTFLALLFIAMIFWGISWPISKILSSMHSPLVVAFARFFLVAVCILPVIFILKIKLSIKRSEIPILVISIISNSSYSLVFFYAITLGSAGVAGVITTTLSPIMATLLSALIFRYKLSSREVLGLILGLISGIFFLHLSSLDTLLNKFNLFFILAAFLWACVSLSVKKISLNPLAINFYTSLFSSILFIPFINFGDLKPLCEPYSLSLILIVAVLSTALGTTIYYKSIEVLGITKSAAFTLLVPFFALLLSWIILSEVPDFNTIIGGILALIAIYLISFFDKSHFKFLKHFKPS